VLALASANHAHAAAKWFRTPFAGAPSGVDQKIERRACDVFVKFKQTQPLVTLSLVDRQWGWVKADRHWHPSNFSPCTSKMKYNLTRKRNRVLLWRGPVGVGEFLQLTGAVY
jgi:hypothetical protein